MKVSGILLCVLMSIGCEAGLLDALNQTIDDPVDGPLRVYSTVEENTIIVEWDSDPGADEYRLERAWDRQSNLEYIKVYQGKQLSYTDLGIKDGDRYVYRLKKHRGSRIFGPYSPALGVGNDVRRDAFEPNNERSQATKIEHTITASIHYYRSWADPETQDVDWYAITVPPGEKASVKVGPTDQITPTNYLNLYVDRVEEFTVDEVPADDDGHRKIDIATNHFPHSQTVYFRLSPNKRNIIVHEEAVGGTLVHYRLEPVWEAP